MHRAPATLLSLSSHRLPQMHCSDPTTGGLQGREEGLGTTLSPQAANMGQHSRMSAATEPP